MSRRTSLYEVAIGDYIAAALLGLACVASIFLLYGEQASVGERTAIIYVNGRKVREIPLADKATVVQHTEHVTLTLQIEAGRIRVAQSDCPRGVCRERGWISSPGETIICLPAKVLIEVQGKKKAGNYDAVSY